MATVLSDSIRRIRTYKRLMLTNPSGDAYSNVVKQEWDNIRQIYRSDEMHTIYEVEGLHEDPVNYWSLSDMVFDIDDISQDLIGLEISIKVKEMRGTDIGRMPLYDN